MEQQARTKRGSQPSSTAGSSTVKDSTIDQIQTGSTKAKSYSRVQPSFSCAHYHSTAPSANMKEHLNPLKSVYQV